jgi:fucose permease
VLALVLPLPAQSHQGAVRLPARRVVRRGAFWLLAGAILLAGMTELGPSNWLPAFVEQAAAGSRRAGALGLLAFGVTMAAGRLTTSAVIHRVGARGLFLAGGALCAAALLLASVPRGPAWSAAWLALLGFGVAGFWPTILACAGDRFPRAGASMFSLLAATGNSGGILAPIAIGFVGEHAGLHAAMRMLALAPVGAVALVWFVVERSRPSSLGEAPRPA